MKWRYWRCPKCSASDETLSLPPLEQHNCYFCKAQMIRLKYPVRNNIVRTVRANYLNGLASDINLLTGELK